MSAYRRILVAWALLLSVAFYRDVAAFAQRPSTLDLRLPATVSLGEPVVLAIAVQNNANEPIVADFGFDNRTKFVFRQTKPDGSRVEARHELPRNGLVFLTQHEIKPSAGYSTMLALDEWLSFAQLGTHRIEVEFAGDVRGKTSGQAVPLTRSFSLSVQVLPQDAERLRQRCEEWLRTGTTGTTADEQLAALSVLRQVVDPVAVPYLETAAGRDSGSVFFGAIRRIGSPDALAALERLAQHRSEGVRQQAQSTLSAMPTWHVATFFSLTGSTSVNVREPLVAEFVLLNPISNVTRVDLGWNQIGRFVFELTRPDGVRQVARPQAAGGQSVAQLPAFQVGAGGRYAQQIRLDEWLDFSRAGAYQLNVRFDGAVVGATGQAIDVRREWPIAITVSPKQAPDR